MLYSKVFGKTIKDVPSDTTLASHKLLYQGGFIRESTAGRYFFLPLGQKVHQKMVTIIKEEMDATGAQEMVSPVLHPLALWEETNRDKATGFELMTIKDRRDFAFALGGTAEEMFVDVVRKFQLSYKDLPFNIYQFSTKFRDEMRARGGLLRVREFVMKDAYSFDKDEESFKKEYKRMWETYDTIFKRLGLMVTFVEADNGYIGGEYCHETIVESEAGESRYFVTEDKAYAMHEDVATFKREEINFEEEEKPFQIIEQPAWVQTMEDNKKHYGLPESRFLKNVVYKNRITNEIIIVVIRGDLEVNKTKLEHVLNAVGLLEDATDEDLKKIGTKRGYVHSWGHTGARYIGDLSLKSVRNFIGGQKEDTKDATNVNYGRDFTTEMLVDVALAKDGFLTEDGKQRLISKRGVEVGNIFQLGYHYSKLMKDATFTDVDGTKKPYYMGCYGLGIARTLATVVESFHDEKGIMWPKNIAPYQVHLIGLGLNEKTLSEKAMEVYKTISNAGIEVLFDDREEVRAGEKFADADLIGIPIRLVISQKTGENVEWKERNKQEVALVPLMEIVSKIKDYYTE